MAKSNSSTPANAYIPMRRSLATNARKIGEGKDGEPDQIADIVKEFGQFKESQTSKIFDNADFGYARVTVEAPPAPAIPDDRRGQGAVPRRLSAPTRRR